MRDSLGIWEPLSISEVSSIFSQIPIIWGIAGGWALEMHSGRKVREHSDTDIVIFREDQHILYQHLKNEWTLYKAKAGALSLWTEGEYLHDVNDIWASRDSQSPWSFQIMFMESNHGQWVYRRDKTIQVPKGHLFNKGMDRIPYLKPEIQLLFKGGSSHIREKDSLDFHSVLPFLVREEKVWLKGALKQQFPFGHEWMKYL